MSGTSRTYILVFRAPREMVAGERSPEEAAESGLPTVLLAEDNPDLRAYVREELSDEFHVLVAANGLKGLELAQGEIPDLILSDVNMPNCDGFEFVKRARSQEPPRR